MKYIVLIGDGMSDEPIPSLSNKTPLQVAKTPNMDLLAGQGICGWVNNVPKGMQPGSDIANMSIFGYNPKEYYCGRAPFEAVSIGVDLKPDEIAFRCNFVSIKNNIMDDFTAGHISTEEASSLIEDLNKNLSKKQNINFYLGLSYRHLMVIKGNYLNTICTPPHDITGQDISKYLPKDNGAEEINQLMQKSQEILSNNQINAKRNIPATMIWLWGQGPKAKMPLFKDKYGLTGVIITAVPLLKGIGKSMGLEVVDVPGATGFIDTNYQGKAQAALDALNKHQIAFVHVEAPDEAGHMGSIEKKITAIEDFDQKVVGYILKNMKKNENVRFLILPDHPTPIAKKTHTGDDVPFIISGKGINPDNIEQYNEVAIKSSHLKIQDGHRLINQLLIG